MGKDGIAKFGLQKMTVWSVWQVCPCCHQTFLAQLSRDLVAGLNQGWGNWWVQLIFCSKSSTNPWFILLPAGIFKIRLVGAEMRPKTPSMKETKQLLTRTDNVQSTLKDQTENFVLMQTYPNCHSISRWSVCSTIVLTGKGQEEKISLLMKDIISSSRTCFIFPQWSFALLVRRFFVRTVCHWAGKTTFSWLNLKF